ncbi:MAG: BglII/BstYI family type II restriction endonuclease [Candidatus Thorarchaeota archaeon]
MMYDTFTYRNADAIIHSKSDRRQEIETMLITLPDKHPVAGLHRKIQNALAQVGWSKEELVSHSLKKVQSFDNYKDRIALEIELSRYEFVYRDYFRFLLAYNEDKIDIGVLIVFTEDARSKYKDASSAPSYQICIDELPNLKPMLGVPIWVIGLA